MRAATCASRRASTVYPNPSPTLPLTLALTLTLALALALTLTKVAEGSGAKAELRPFDASQVLSGETVSGRVEVKNFHSSWSSEP